MHLYVCLALRQLLQVGLGRAYAGGVWVLVGTSGCTAEQLLVLPGCYDKQAAAGAGLLQVGQAAQPAGWWWCSWRDGLW